MILKQITRKTFQMVCIAFLSITVFISCSKDDDAAEDLPSFTAMVNGVPFSTNSVNSGYSFGTSIIALNDQGSMISIMIWETGEGTYILSDPMDDDGTGIYVNYGEGKDYSTGNEGGSGEIVITKYDTVNGLLSGTFHFTGIYEIYDENDNLIGTESIEITNGVFTDINLEPAT